VDDRGGLLAFHLDEWYCFGSVNTLQEYGIQFKGFGRPDGLKTPIWVTENSGPLHREAYPKFDKEFRQTIREYCPDVFVIFGDNGIFETGMLHICRQLKVPSVLVLEAQVPRSKSLPKPNLGLRSIVKMLRGLASKAKGKASNLFAKARRAELHGIDMPVSRGFGLNGANLIAAVKPEDRCWFAEHGVNSEHVVVTGSVVMDRLWRFVQEQGIALNPLECAPTRRPPPCLLVISSGLAHFGGEEEQRWFVNQIRTLVEGEDRARLRVNLRLKPGESIEDWRKVWPVVDKSAYLVSSAADLHLQIASADVIVAIHSQALIEALMIGKPVINLAPAGEKGPFRLVERGVAYCATSSDDIVRMLHNQSTLKLSKEQVENRDKCYEEFFYRFDGKAGERVAEVIQRASCLKAVL
jgi:hypothetical protein